MNHYPIHVDILMRGLRDLEPEYVTSDQPDQEDDEITFAKAPDFSIQVGHRISHPYVGLNQWVDNRTAMLNHGVWPISTPSLAPLIRQLVEQNS